MHNFFLVARVRLDEALNLSRFKYSDSISDRLQLIFTKLIRLIIYIILCLLFYAFYDSLAQAGIVSALPVMSYFFASAISVLVTIISINEILTGYSDSEFLLSTPVSEFVHVLIMLINVYIRSFVYVLMVEGTAGLIYIKYATPVGFMGGWILGLFITNLPLLGIACLIGTVITLSIVHSPNRDQIQSRITMAVIIVAAIIIIIVANKIGDIVINVSADSAETANAIISLFVKNFRFSRIYQYAVVDSSIGYAVLFPFISVLWFVVFALCFAVGYRTMIVAFRCPADFKVYTWKPQKKMSPGKAMFLRELNKIMRSKTYMIRTMTAFIVGLILAVSTLIFGSNLLMNIFNAPAIIGLICLFTGIGNTTYCSYSIEGKQNYITLTAPVKEGDIILSKVMVNLVISIPYSLVCGIFYSVSVDSTPGMKLAYICLPVLFAVALAFWGALVDRRFADYSKESEEAVMHQGMSYVLGFLPGVILPVVYMLINIRW